MITDFDNLKVNKISKTIVNSAQAILTFVLRFIDLECNDDDFEDGGGE